MVKIKKILKCLAFDGTWFGQETFKSWDKIRRNHVEELLCDFNEHGIRIFRDKYGNIMIYKEFEKAKEGEI